MRRGKLSIQNYPVTLIANHHLVSDFYLATFDYQGPEPKPGQFINLAVEPFFLKRPFAVFDYKENQLNILYKVVGEGTKHLSTWSTGHKTEVLGILGNFFTRPQGKAVLVGGGTGIASLYYFSRTFDKDLTIILGVNHKEEALVFENLFEEIGAEVKISTLDGSHGFKGNAVDYTLDLLKNENDFTLYACGPHGMLNAFNEKINNKELSPHKTWVSLEGRMGCGFGACLGCAVETIHDEFYYVCKDGPIFDMNVIKW